MIRDLLYLDFEKLASIFSQTSGGLLERTEDTVEEGQDTRNLRKYDLKFFKPEFGGILNERTSQVESRVLHHDLLVRVEDYLFDEGYAVDVNAVSSEGTPSAVDLRLAVSQVAYFRAEGWATIEDFARFKSVAAEFNNVAKFIRKCAVHNVKTSEVYLELKGQIEELKEGTKKIKDRNERTQAQAPLKALETRLDGMVSESSEGAEIPDWLAEGLRHFIDTIMPHRINLRLYPSEAVPEFEILANLKRDCFVDSDATHLHFTYGYKPSVQLTMLGLVTGLPSDESAPVDGLLEARERQAEADEDKIGRGFLRVFDSLDDLEEMVIAPRYPGIAAYPLAVYRSVSPRDDDLRSI